MLDFNAFMKSTDLIEIGADLVFCLVVVARFVRDSLVVHISEQNPEKYNGKIKLLT